MNDIIKPQGFILDELTKARDNLYEDLPTGTLDAFELIKIIKNHINQLDIILDYYDKVWKYEESVELLNNAEKMLQKRKANICKIKNFYNR